MNNIIFQSNGLMEQTTMFFTTQPPPPQLLKWVGNKHRFASQIISNFPKKYNKYIEPFVGTGAVLSALSPHKAIAGDILKPLIEIMTLLQNSPDVLIESYSNNWEAYQKDRRTHYQKILDSFNTSPNALDLLFLSRTCYGGVVRFTKEGKMSTPIGPHKPIPPASFAKRAYLWRERVKNTTFLNADYRETMSLAEAGDIIYCDPPYIDSQAILYGAQKFRINELFNEVEKCVKKGAKVKIHFIVRTENVYYAGLDFRSSKFKTESIHIFIAQKNLPFL